MNKLTLSITMIIIGILIGIFYITQKDMIDGLFEPAPTPNLPSNSGALDLTLLSQKPEKNGIENVKDQLNPKPTFGVEEGVKASYSATIKTDKGDIGLTIYGSDAPNTVKNFINKAESGFYNDLIFHRVEDWVIQGGDPNGDGTGGNLIQTELNRRPFVEGSLGVARGGDIRASNDSQFFITKSDASWLNEKYTNFGIVTSGMDVVNEITKGDKILEIIVEK